MLLYRALALAAATVALPLGGRHGTRHRRARVSVPRGTGVQGHGGLLRNARLPDLEQVRSEIRRICEEYATRGARCVLAYIDPTISIADIREHQRAYGITAPTVHDKSHAMANLAGASITPEGSRLRRHRALGVSWADRQLLRRAGHAPAEGYRTRFEERLGRGAVRPTGLAVAHSSGRCFIPSLDLAKTEEFQ